MAVSEGLKRTPLHGVHLEYGARMVSFAGFEMPIQYSGIIDEHMAVRQAAGLFDVSHMGEVFVRGPRALEYVQRLVTNDASKLYDGRAMYTVMCRPHGGIVDDLLVYRFSEDEYMLVINAANIPKDLEWLRENESEGADLDDAGDRLALLAIQGPRAFEIVREAGGPDVSDLKFYHFLQPDDFLGKRGVVLSHTGYTGEPGLEIYCDPADAASIWEVLMSAGTSHGLKPCGLGSRDTLRIEAGFALYGNDITEETNPLEAGLGWLVKLEKGDFIGRDELLQVKERGTDRKLVGFTVEDRGIPRAGLPIQSPDGAEIGVVTSGTQSPMLQKGVGLGYVANDPAFTAEGAGLRILSRGRPLHAVVQRPPFHKK